VNVRTLAVALKNELAPATNPDGTIDVTHITALTYLARRPFGADQEPPEIDGNGYLFTACVFGKVDVHHPAARAYLSRVWGTPATTDEIARKLAQ
jgi:hypothetical protein